MRLFFALEMPPSVRQRLAALVEPLRRKAAGVRWVDPHGIHLTLRFLGEVQPERLEAIVAAARAGLDGRPAPRLRTGELEVFPERGRPRVVWVGVEDEAGALADLHRALEGALEPLGFAPEGRPYSPHLTLGRVREGGDPRRALSEVTAPEPLSFRVAEAVLMESLLGDAPARYEVRARFALREGP